MTGQVSLTTYTAAFVDELVRSGTRHAVISPGSRSTPLALLMAEHPDLKVWLHVDERSAAFFALGIAKAKNEPVAILCTSGTAAANYYPAVIEAQLSRVPLVVLTADRPHELRDSGAPQTIDQVRLFGTYPKWFVDMALPEQSNEMLRYARTTASRAAASAMTSPAGPVHVNFPFREPLLPDLSLPSLWEGGREHRNIYTSVAAGNRSCTDEFLKSLGEKLQAYKKGLFVCGPLNDASFANDLVQLAEKLHFPILADPLSQLRTGSHHKDIIIDSYDAFLRVPDFFNQYKPDTIVRFGSMPVSKALLLYIKNNPDCRQIIIDEGDGWRDPTLSASDIIYSDPSDFCKRLAAFVPQCHQEEKKRWLSAWQDINAISKETVRNAATNNVINEGQAMLEAVSMLHEQSLLFVGNSMPIRDLDTFLFNQSKPLRTMANRGANGIDGVVSTALGASIDNEPLVLVIGDLSFFHDLNGLLAAKLHNLNATIMIINNDGGGIFSFLPQAESNNAHFEHLFGTPIGLNFEHAIEMYGGTFERVTDWTSFKECYAKSIQTNGLNVIEVITDRKENVQLHRDIWDLVAEAVVSSLQGVDN